MRKTDKASRELGISIVQRVAKVWQVDEARVRWGDSSFEWWPGSFRVLVSATQAAKPSDDPAWRVVVRTDFLADFPVGDRRKRQMLGAVSAFAPSYAWVYAPPEFGTRGIAKEDSGKVWFQSTAYVREDTAGWLPEYLARLTLMQAIYAQGFATAMASAMGARPDISSPNGLVDDGFRDDVLNVVESVYVPAGKSASRWAGSAEFAKLVEQLNESETVFATGDPDGLTAEAAFGQSTSLVRLLTTSQHPGLGSGLLVALQLPGPGAEAGIAGQCALLNCLESTSWTGFPQLGSWRPREIGDKLWSATQASFVPNALYNPGIAANMGLWHIGRSQWVHETLLPSEATRSLTDILKARLGR